jgi:hypothetical protein
MAMAYLQRYMAGHYDFCKSDPERVNDSFEGNKLEGNYIYFKSTGRNS